MHFPLKVKLRFNQVDCLCIGTAHEYAIASGTFMTSLEKQLFPLEKTKCRDNIYNLAGCHPLKTRCSCEFPHTALHKDNEIQKTLTNIRLRSHVAKLPDPPDHLLVSQNLSPKKNITYSSSNIELQFNDITLGDTGLK